MAVLLMERGGGGGGGAAPRYSTTLQNHVTVKVEIIKVHGKKVLVDRKMRNSNEDVRLAN